MQVTNRPSTIERQAVQGFTPFAFALNLERIRNWTQIDSDDLSDEDLQALLEPLTDKFEGNTALALRNGAWLARFENWRDWNGSHCPLLIPGYAAHPSGFTDALGNDIVPGEESLVGARLDALVRPPERGWPFPLRCTVIRGVTETHDMPSGLEMAYAGEVKRTWEGLESYRKIVMRYLQKYRRISTA